LSVRFSLARSSTDYATNFAIFLKRHSYLEEFQAYNPNAWCKDSCDPSFTDINHPCRGTIQTCSFLEAQNLVQAPSGEMRPANQSCWRYSFRFHLQKSKETNGFMIQVQEQHGLGDGQRLKQRWPRRRASRSFGQQPPVRMCPIILCTL